MFKAGDKVRCIDAEGTTVLSCGEEYEVVEVDGKYLQVLVNGRERGMYASRFELVEQPWQPKVGDRVVEATGKKYGLAKHWRDFWEMTEGKLTDNAFVVVQVEGRQVRYSNRVDGNGPWVTSADLEPLPVVAEAQPPLRIVEGRHYKTRDGRKVGPMETFLNMFSAEVDGTQRIFQADGTHGSQHVPNLPRLDLIAEWIDEPAVPSDTVAVAATASNDNAAPKFKVGDVVVATRDYADVTKGNRYTIIEVDAEDEELPIRVKDDAGDGWWLDHDAFEIITPAAPSSTAGFTIPLVDEEPEPLTVTLALDADAFHEDLDEIIAKLKKIRKLQRQTGLAA